MANSHTKLLSYASAAPAVTYPLYVLRLRERKPQSLNQQSNNARYFLYKTCLLRSPFKADHKRLLGKVSKRLNEASH